MWYVVVHGYYNKNYLKTLVNRFHLEYISHDLLRHITQHINCVNTQDILKETARHIKTYFEDITLESLSNFFKMARECDYFRQRTEIKATIKAIMGSNSLKIFFFSIKFNKLSSF